MLKTRLAHGVMLTGHPMTGLTDVVPGAMVPSRLSGMSVVNPGHSVRSSTMCAFCAASVGGPA